jgi:hypothetical protein
MATPIGPSDRPTPNLPVQAADRPKRWRVGNPEERRIIESLKRLAKRRSMSFREVPRSIDRCVYRVPAGDACLVRLRERFTELQIDGFHVLIGRFYEPHEFSGAPKVAKNYRIQVELLIPEIRVHPMHPGQTAIYNRLAGEKRAPSTLREVFGKIVRRLREAGLERSKRWVWVSEPQIVGPAEEGEPILRIAKALSGTDIRSDTVTFLSVLKQADRNDLNDVHVGDVAHEPEPEPPPRPKHKSRRKS